jgi:hypothetical protein
MADNDDSFPPLALTGDQISAIVASSIQAVTSSTLALDPSLSLQDFGVFTPEQVAQLTAMITSSVSQNGFTLAPNALATIGPSTTIADLESAIHDGAEPNE